MRDGLQSEPATIPSDDKVRLVEMPARAGLKRLEVSSFVGPDLPPQRAIGLASALASLEAGCSSFDSNFGELGGCPMLASAPGTSRPRTSSRCCTRWA